MPIFINSCCGERKLTYHESGFDLIFFHDVTYRTQFDLTLWKYCTSKLTITSHNYLTNMSFPTIFEILKDLFFHLISCLKVKVEITCNLHSEKNKIKVT